jgi:hypothetical protein
MNVDLLGQGRSYAKNVYDDFVEYYGTLKLLLENIHTLPNDLAWPMVARRYYLVVCNLLDDFTRTLTEKKIAIVHRFPLAMQQIKADCKAIADAINDATEKRTFRDRNTPLRGNESVLR